uniref:Uncharacterized protein n=2 Tax=Cucumis sativus TaxID=3659 RepID=A0A0A0M241_CUCSA
MMDDQELYNEDNNISYRESRSQVNDQGDDFEGNDQDALAEAGLEDSDAEDEAGAPSSNAARRRATWSDSEEDEPIDTQRESRLQRENSAGLEDSDGEIR